MNDDVSYIKHMIILDILHLILSELGHKDVISSIYLLSCRTY